MPDGNPPELEIHRFSLNYLKGRRAVVSSQNEQFLHFFSKSPIDLVNIRAHAAPYSLTVRTRTVITLEVF